MGLMDQLGRLVEMEYAGKEAWVMAAYDDQVGIYLSSK
jgi:hypothetical protein